ncbi:MAG: hypothetical protein AMXMBFR61_18120 [Fimbriimonadales bacterium]
MRFLRHNLAEKLMAIALTFLLFYTVDRAQTPNRQMSLTKRVEYENVPKGLKVVHGDDVTVRLTVTGDRASVDAITASDLDSVKVSVPLGNGRRGTASYAISLSIPPDLLENLTWQVDRRRVDVTLVAETDRTVPVEVVPTKPMPAGVDLSDWIAEPEQVIVSGNERDVDRVARARILFDPTDPTGPAELRPIELVSRSGAMVRGDLTVSPAKGRVLPASTELRTKRVAVSPRWKGRLPFGYRLTGFRITPGQALVRGPGVALAKLDELATEPIDLWGITSSRTVTVPIATPIGVTILDSSTVEVRVDVEQTEGAE